MTGAFWRVGHEHRDEARVLFEDDELLRLLLTGFGSIANVSNRSAYELTVGDIRKISWALQRDLDSATGCFPRGAKSDYDGFRIE